ncbi:hypothetical protein DFJ58DRAFT_452928 [Suillus subalutaceus]|uniref:uncharacterized protein n=1 Tax=Suillus subalutaceus TaxID=48586 RepID=UPI001B88429C|nr:uncharacterized protein DFJ58DRAFT_452928 [Suillus subalutaceus]KAG1849270.1 hypothetical protein DFJ58DRAFT_452928 [Suillus subalutaceus]
MPFSQLTSTSFLPVPSAFTRLRRSIKIRMHAPSVFESFVPSHLTLKRRSSLSSTRTQKSSFTSRATKRRSLLPSLKLSSSSLSSWSSRDTESSSKPVDSDSSPESTIPDIIVTPASPICTSALTSPPPLGKKITDRFWPEEDLEHDDQDDMSGNGRFSSPMIVNALSPPPYHRRAPNVIVHQDHILSSDTYPSHYRNQHDSRPMRFPF